MGILHRFFEIHNPGNRRVDTESCGHVDAALGEVHDFKSEFGPKESLLRFCCWF